jgi:prepilin-type N-terminal cleavage/methylation domain-containing protein
MFLPIALNTDTASSMRDFQKNISQGFTLVELLIVVIILALLAAVVVPQFGESTQDAKLAALDANLKTMRDAIDLYTLHHQHFPGAVKSNGTCAVGTNLDTATPGAAAFVAHLTHFTTKSGVACSQGNASSGSDIKYGPYLREIPTNTITGENLVTAIQTGDLLMVGSGTDQNGGWLYDFVVGKFIADQPSYGTR